MIPPGYYPQTAYFPLLHCQPQQQGHCQIQHNSLKKARSLGTIHQPFVKDANNFPSSSHNLEGCKTSITINVEKNLRSTQVEGCSNNNNSGKKSKYTETDLKPDCSLPPVIRRRNQNRRRQLAASMVEGSPMPNSWSTRHIAAPAAVQKAPSNHIIASNGTLIPSAAPAFIPSQFVSGTPSEKLGQRMVSSSSVCDLNSLAQQQRSSFQSIPTANNFHQHNMMGFNGSGNMMWIPCNFCPPPLMYPATGGMKRAISNISMHQQSTSNEINGYPWSNNSHFHNHQMPFIYPGYYPAYHQPMVAPISMPGSAMSIPETIRNFTRVTSSPVPSGWSYRSHRSSKSHLGRHRSRNRSEESESDSLSDHEKIEIPFSRTKTSLSWQCEHCTFINPGHVQSCVMCSKIPRKHPDELGSKDKNGGRRSDHNKSNLSDSKMNGHGSRNDNRSKESAKGSGKCIPSRHKDFLSRTPSLSGSNEEDHGERIDKRMGNLRLSSQTKDGDYDRISISRTRERESIKREGGSRYKNRGRYKFDVPERSRTPGTSTTRRSRTPARLSPKSARALRRTSTSISDEEVSLQDTNSLASSSDMSTQRKKSSLEGTLKGTLASSQIINRTNAEDKLHKKVSNSSKSCSDSSINNDPIVGYTSSNDDSHDNSEEYQHVDRKDRERTGRDDHNSSSYCNPVCKTSKGEIEDQPSFANTLDGIETLKTEVADDVDLMSQALEDELSNPEITLPDVEDVISVLTCNADKPKNKETHPKKDIFNTSKEVNSKKFDNDTKESISFQNDRHNASVNKTTESYEAIETPEAKLVKHEEMVTADNNKNIEIFDEDIYQTICFMKSSSAHHDEGTLGKELPQDLTNKTNGVTSSGELNISLSSSSSSSNILQKQGSTPLSFSSSEALFYSPSVSPDLPANENLLSNQEQIIDLIEKDQKEEEKCMSINSVPTSNAKPSSAVKSHQLKRSFSEQILSSTSRTCHTTEQPLMKEREKNVPSLLQADDEEEIDENKNLTAREIIVRKKHEAMKRQGFEIVQILREAEQLGYTSEDVAVALTQRGDLSAIEWLQQNWSKTIDTVITLASNYGHERQVNDIGEISKVEAKKALRAHKGDVWAAVTECVEQRQRKFHELSRRGNFKREEIIKSLERHEGNSNEAYLELSKNHQQRFDSFFKKIWAPADKAMSSVSSLFRRGSKTKMSDETSIQIPIMREENHAIKNECTNLEYNEASVHENDDTEQGKQHGSIDYANKLMRRLEQRLEKNTREVLALSDDLKMKIVEAILEADQNACKDNSNVDSDDESTMEELESTAENPTFYEYFTAVDLEKEYESNSTTTKKADKIENKEDSIHGKNAEGEDGTVVTTDFEFKKKFDPITVVTVDSELSKKNDDGVTANQRGNPLPSSTHQDLKNSKTFLEKQNVLDVQKKSEDVKDVQKEPINKSKKSTTEKVSPKVELIEMTRNLKASPKVESTEMIRDVKDCEDDDSDNADDGPISVTTGSISLSLKNSGVNKHSNIDVKSLTIKTEVRPVPSSHDGPKETLNSEVGSQVGRKDMAMQALSEGSLSKEAAEVKSTESLQIDKQASAKKPKKDVTQNHVSGEEVKLKTDGQVTVKKASLIVGKAIAKAMARESSVRRDSYQSESDSGTPDSRPSTPDLEETEEVVVDVHQSESEEEFLRSLDTIPEEEESSRKTESDSIALRKANTKLEDKRRESSIPKFSSIPPAVPSYSGPIFIPSVASMDQPSPLRCQRDQTPKGRQTTYGTSEDNSTKDHSLSSTERATEDSTSKGNVNTEENPSQSMDNRNQPLHLKLEKSQSPSREFGSNLGTGGQLSSSGAKKDSAGEKVIQEDEDQEYGSDCSDEEKFKLPAERESENKGTSGSEEEMSEGGEEENEKYLILSDSEKEDYEQLKFDRTVRRLLAEGHSTSYEKAELAAQLFNLSFDESDSIQAAEGCSSIYTAIQFLQQECELCTGKFPMGKMVSMLHCVHRCCYDCANNYFSFQIKTKNIRELRCPFCNEPDLDTPDPGETAAEYLNNLDILLKNIVDEETHELFQRKLRDWTLMKDPNFKWCNKCSSGFIANPRARKLICPDCRDVTCAQCRKQWEVQHEGISCEEFATWKDENDPGNQAEGVAKHLAECGITCPKCRFTYSLAKGGCMHFTCMECRYEFCSGCNKPFKQGAKCTIGPYCERLGLHAHHPRNCLFYLRDKEPGQLQQLLRDHDIPYDTENPYKGDSRKIRPVCRVQEQKETSEGLKDDSCGRITCEGQAGLCRLHYIEYLVELINGNGLDPVTIFDEADLRVCLRRNGKSVPIRRWESEKLYRDKLMKLIKEQLPLI